MVTYYLIRSNKTSNLQFVASDSLTCHLPCNVVGYLCLPSPLNLMTIVEISKVINDNL